MVQSSTINAHWGTAHCLVTLLLANARGHAANAGHDAGNDANRADHEELVHGAVRRRLHENVLAPRLPRDSCCIELIIIKQNHLLGTKTTKGARPGRAFGAGVCG